MKAVIAGATGLVGSIVIEKLLENPKISGVVAVSRRSLKIQNSKLQEVLVADFSQLAMHRELLQGDIYFCCLGTTIRDAGSQESFRKVDFDAIVEFAKIAKAHQTKSFTVISAMGANPKSSIFYNRVKGETEKALQALKFESLTIFRPGLLLGHRPQPRRGEKFATTVFQKLSPILPSRLEKTLATHADHLADRMIETALNAKPGVQVIASTQI
jgi:uncharacterized protein YbjT (DUF2867 family)